MKSMQPRHNFLRETTEPPQSPNPSSGKPRVPRKHKASKENAPPSSDLNYTAFDSKPSPAAKLKSPLPPRPPPSNPLKRKLEMLPENSVHGASDSGVQVIVRMRPPRKDRDEGEMMVQKTAGDSLSINGQTFTFDSVADTDASQLDIFQLVGVPLVENCMAGFNSSVFAYGQTGSGKTYTMWGPANALLDENLSSDQQGLTPRVLERLFARINEEQIKHADKQLKYQCQCSFLEIYNEQITDLLDPNPKSLQIREDVKSGVYVENLTEECVRTIKDVTQLLIKGLSNRRTGSTSINADSSRSHTVFTCVVESRYKSVADGTSSFKRSRINLVDLAGSERQKLTGAAGERLKEAGNINRSLSQLGNLINILAEISQTGKQRHIPYRDSRLTFLLQESLGGNAKLAMVCAVSPTQSCKSETFSTLRFAQRAKAIKNKAVVNEVMQDDVNHLREVIRQLRDELQRIKANGKNAVDANGGHSAAWFRQSLNILKASLNRPMMSSHIDDDGDEEMEIDEEAVERLCDEVANQSVGCYARNLSNVSNVDTSKSHSELMGVQIGSSDVPQTRTSGSGFVTEQGSDDTDVKMEEEISDVPQKHTFGSACITEQGPDDTNVKMEEAISEQEESMIVDSVADTPDITSSSICNLLTEESASKKVHDDSSCEASEQASVVSEYLSVADEPNKSQNVSVNCVSPSLMIVPCDVTPILKSPTPSVSPRVNTSRKSLRTSSMMTASQKDLFDGSQLSPKAVEKPEKIRSSIDPSTQTCKNFSAPAEQLAASIRHGLEIIGSQRHSSALRRSAFRFSLKPSESRQILPVPKVDAGVQTVDELPQEDSVDYICNNCKNRMELEGKEANELSKMELVPVDASEPADKSRMQVPKAVEKVLAGAIRREMALEDICAKKTSEIMQLNRLVQQYKHERECNAIISQTREDKILRLESLMDGVLPTEEFMEEELVSLTHDYKLLKEKYENHPELLRTKIELKRVQDELENLRNFNDMGEREVLLEEIQDLRSQLQYYVDSSSTSSRTRNSVLQLTYSCEPKLAPLSTIQESNEESVEQKFEQERKQWTEVESTWISLSEELRTELEASRSLVEKTKQELETEKKCAEELKEAMQRAMEGQSRMLEQYADLEEKHMELLIRHRKIRDGVEDVKKAAAKAGVRGAESKFINSLAAEITTLRLERERERRYLRDENKGLQAQLQDTAEAVQAAGELLIRLKEADEAVALRYDGGVKPTYHKRKIFYNRERSQRDTLCKRRKMVERSSVVTSDGGFSGESVSYSPEKGMNGDKSVPAANGVSSSVIGPQASLHSKESHVKFRIKSFKVPELFIEVPETETVGSLKRTVMEAVNAILNGGLSVGVLVQGKKVRDDNRTLLQTGISCKDNLDSLGFTLEPSPVQAPPSLCPVDSPPLSCEASVPLPRSPSTPLLDSGISDAISDPPPLTNSGSLAESNHESVSSLIDPLTNKAMPECRAIVALPDVNMEPLAAVPMNQKSKRSELVQRRTRRPFSVSEVEALVQAVEKLGTGRWRDVKLCAFENADHRTYVDLKDKWKTLVHTAQISPQRRRGEPVPQELLDRVLTVHSYWCQHQAKQQVCVPRITDTSSTDRHGAERYSAIV